MIETKPTALTEKAKILVIDDEPGMRDMLSHELSLNGYAVQTASDGIEALEKMERDKFQLAICDINMPKLGGMEVLDALRNRDADIEIIMMTGYATIESAVASMKKGAYDFVQKPFDLEKMLVLVEKSLEKNNLKLTMAVYEASRSIFQTIKLESLLPLIANLSLKILKADDVSIMILGDDGKLTVKASAGAHNPERDRASVALGESVAGNVAKWTEPVIISDGTMPRDAVKSSIVHPLLIDDQLVGVININRVNNNRPFNQIDLRSATIFSSQVAQAIYNARLYRHLEETQKRLIQSEKLSCVGQLAAGIAHEFNNILTAITLSAGFVKDALPEGNPVLNDVEEILKAGHEAGLLTQQLLTFSQKHISRPQISNLNELISNFNKMLGRMLGENVSLRTEMEDHLWPVKADPLGFEQILMILAANSREALPSGGLFTIQTANFTVSPEEASQHDGVSPGPYVVMTVSDNGKGMDKEVMSHLFEPFFTSRGRVKSTGLGLASVYGIVKQGGGFIEVESEPNKGATFKIYLPRTQEVVSGVNQPPIEKSLTEGSRTILLVEDEPALRAMALRTLKKQGYTVLEASDGKEALNISESQARSIDLVVTDVVMRKIGGLELVSRLQFIYPGIKVLFMSGYLDNPDVSRCFMENGILIQKPFTPEALSATVRTLLDAADPVK